MNSMTRQLLRSLPLLMLVAACGGGASDAETAATVDTMAAGPLSVADTPTRARAADGRYISWKEHIIDDEATGGVAIAGSDTVNGLAAQKAKEIFGVGQVIGLMHQGEIAALELLLHPRNAAAGKLEAQGSEELHGGDAVLHRNPARPLQDHGQSGS